jgi:hypothetical protein
MYDPAQHAAVIRAPCRAYPSAEAVQSVPIVHPKTERNQPSHRLSLRARNEANFILKSS